MTTTANHKSVSVKLSLWMLLFTTVIFILSLGFLYMKSCEFIRQECIERSAKLLDNMSLKVRNYLNEVETAANNTHWQVMAAHLNPDSLMCISRRVVKLNPNINGCSITMEPYFFPSKGRYFSAYTIRAGDSLVSLVEESYNYTEKTWYKKPRENGKCWVEPYSGYNARPLCTKEIIASYGIPLYISDSTFIGVFSTELSLKWLYSVFQAAKPYPHSYCMMLGKNGCYFAHPDSTRLFRQTIFSMSDPEQNADVYALGYEMANGKNGYMRVNIDNESCLVFYRPLTDTDCSLALVCPESDILADYNRLGFIVALIIIVGLFFITVLCRRIINRHIKPLNALTVQVQSIAKGNFSESLPLSTRHDEVGQLQNSFAVMQQSIGQHVSHIQAVNKEMSKSNEQLMQADRQAQEASSKKTAFVQDMTHQIRTPLNIIIGFAQVLRDSNKQLSEKEKQEIIRSMQKNSASVSRMVDILLAASVFENMQSLPADDNVSCNEVARKALSDAVWMISSDITPMFETTLPDTLTLHTNKAHLTSVLRELVINALKFTNEGYVRLSVKASGDYVRFIVEDTGKGIVKADRERIFTNFFKLDHFSEGLGLGLSVSKRVTELIGGTLTLDTSYKKGSRFIVALHKR